MKAINQSLHSFFNRDQGVILGSTAVVSQKVHEEARQNPGEIHIFRNRDAGENYLKLKEKHQVVHIDVLHKQAVINQFDLATRLRQIVPHYLDAVDRNHDWTDEEKNYAANSLSRRIQVYTAMGHGNLLDPSQHDGRGPDDRFMTHVHVLARLKARYLSLAYCLIDEVEKAVRYQGAELRPVLKIVHFGEPDYDQSTEMPTGIYLPQFTNSMPEHIRRQNLYQIIMSLAMRMGSLDAVGDFFQALAPIKNLRLHNLHRRHEDLDKILQQLTAGKLIKKSLLGYTMTDLGRELEEFMQRHKKDIAAQLRKSIRKFPADKINCQTYHYSHLRSKEKQFPNRRKILPAKNETWRSEVAVPETVVQAAKRSFLAGRRAVQIEKQDIMVYGRKSHAPVDTCLLIDCSGSMMGERIKAVNFVAEHLLLTTREKVAIVTFQERDARIAVPFTRSYDELHAGLAGIRPEGLTPLAKGIVTTLDLVKKERPRNPLLILITDGIPNYPLWTVDPIADALKAAAMIADRKLRFVCIGIDPDHKFLPDLAAAGKGNTYIVDDSDKNTLVNIIRDERKKYQYG
jgi:magnesium chelatase subunit D